MILVPVDWAEEIARASREPLILSPMTNFVSNNKLEEMITQSEGVESLNAALKEVKWRRAQSQRHINEIKELKAMNNALKDELAQIQRNLKGAKAVELRKTAMNLKF